jgi:uncharacterized protein (TIGR03382 family)
VKAGPSWLVLWLALAGTAQAAIEHDVDVEAFNRSGKEITFNVTVGAGEARYALVSVAVSGTGARVASAALGSSALGFINAAESAGGGCRTEWWGLRNPPVGAGVVRVELASEPDLAGATFVSYRGVDQHRPLGALAAAGGMSPPTEVTLSAAPGALALDNVCGWGPRSVIDLAGGGQTARWHWSSGYLSTAGSQKAGQPNVSLTWTATGDMAMAWGAAGLVLNPVADAPVTSIEIGSAGCSTAGRPGGGIWALALALVAARRLRRLFREPAPGTRV